MILGNALCAPLIVAVGLVSWSTSSVTIGSIMLLTMARIASSSMAGAAGVSVLISVANAAAAAASISAPVGSGLIITIGSTGSTGSTVAAPVQPALVARSHVAVSVSPSVTMPLASRKRRALRIIFGVYIVSISFLVVLVGFIVLGALCRCCRISIPVRFSSCRYSFDSCGPKSRKLYILLLTGDFFVWSCRTY